MIMIKRIETLDIKELSLRNSHYSRLIKAHLKTYGVEFDFCELYGIYSSKLLGYIVCFNGSMVADIVDSAKITAPVRREIREFVSFKSPQSIELCKELYSRVGFSGYERSKRTFFEVIANGDGSMPDIIDDYDYAFSVAYDSSRDSFGLWLTDTVRRVNRNLSRLYTYGSSVLTVRFMQNGYAYITDVATPEKDRGKGYARTLLRGVADILKNEGYFTYLCAEENSSGFYKSLNFSEMENDIIFKKRDCKNE